MVVRAVGAARSGCHDYDYIFMSARGVGLVAFRVLCVIRVVYLMVVGITPYPLIPMVTLLIGEMFLFINYNLNSPRNF